MTSPHSPMLSVNDGREISQLGFGVYRVSVVEATRVVVDALGLDNRYVDIAAFRDNEVGLGRGISASGVPRSRCAA